MKHGKGEFEWDDGTKLEGLWVFGNLEGIATFFRKKDKENEVKVKKEE